MLRRFGLLYYVLGLSYLLRRLGFTDRSADNVRRAAEKGPVVYVLHTRSRMDWLALNRVLNSRRLPLARVTVGLGATAFEPLRQALRKMKAALHYRMSFGSLPDPLASGWLGEQVRQGMTTAIFLVEPGRKAPRPDPLEVLARAQEQCDAPIQLVPVVALWRKAPEPARTEVGRFLMGSQDEPGPLQKLYSVATRHPDALVQAGEPLDFRELLDRYADDPEARRIRAARILLRRYLYREAHVVRGPRSRPYRWTRRLVMQSPEVRHLITREAEVTGRGEPYVRARVERTLDHIAARVSYPWTRLVGAFCTFLWNRIFTSVDFPDEDVERIRVALRQGTPILVPCHRSHLDYLLVSSLLYDRDIVIPHVVAGENLSFFPLGAVLRRTGGFFIKRAFQGDRVFPVVFQRYLKQLVRDGFPVEFFIEGGRSRTGKLLPPKLGVLGMILDAAGGARQDREVTFLPMAITYEQIAEGQAFARELTGSQKRDEDVGEVVRASKVVRKRFGSVFIRVGSPLCVRDLFDTLQEPWESLDPEERKEVLQEVGERLLHGIAQAMVVAPTNLAALALMAGPHRGTRLPALQSRFDRLAQLLSQRGAHASFPSHANEKVLERALERFESERMLRRVENDLGPILTIPSEQRIRLEYYKNGLIHMVAPASLLANAMLACPDARPDDLEVIRLFRVQVFLLRYEFTLDPQVPLEELTVRATRDLRSYQALSPDEASLRTEERLRELAELTRNFLESYLLALRAARVLMNRDLGTDELPQRMREVGKGLIEVEELRRAESLSIANLKNAVQAFREEGVLQMRTGGGGLQFDESATNQYMSDLGRLLD
jgi:glycerol-3-phosphate O-acyltransferase